jgi:uncharacterized membrane protein YcjF (UPF0283 family)
MDRVARRVAKLEQGVGELDFLTARLAAAAGRVCRARNLTWRAKDGRAGPEASHSAAVACVCGVR